MRNLKSLTDRLPGIAADEEAPAQVEKRILRRDQGYCQTSCGEAHEEIYSSREDDLLQTLSECCLL